MNKGIAKALDNPIPFAIAGTVVLVGLWWLSKKTLTAAADAVGGVVSGNNAVTQNQTNASGEKTTAYEGAGLAGTVGATFNSASGGVFASVGEWIGGKAFDLFGKRAPANETYYAVRFPDGKKHAISSLSVQQNGYFSYGGVQYRLGTLNGEKIATRVQ